MRGIRAGGNAATGGVYTVPVTASNAYGTASATLTIVIADAPAVPVIASNAAAQATVGTPFYYTVYISSDINVATPLSYGAAGLPPGLSIDATSGAITGTPTSAGNYTAALSATSVGVTGTSALNLTVAPAPATPPAPLFTGPAGLLGYTANPLAYSLAGTGFSPDAGGLPPGLSFDAASGIISGYPAAAGSTDVPLSGANAAGNGHAVLNVRVLTPSLSLPRITLQPIAGQTVAQGQSASFGAAAVGVPNPGYQWLHDGAAIAGAAQPALTMAGVQPVDAGAYVLTAINSAGGSASTASVLAVTQSYAGWQAANFTQAEIAAGLAAPASDFNQDGVTNLLDYALGRDPRTGQGGSLPLVSTPAGGGGLQIQFVRDTGKTDLGYLVESSPDLQTWTGIASSTAGNPTANLGGAAAVAETGTGGLRTVAVQDGHSVGTGGPRFLRLRVTGP